MIPDSFIARHIIYALALLQTAVAPLAFVYYVFYIVTETPLFVTDHALPNVFLHYWLGCELIFYVYFQITRDRMQGHLQPTFPDLKERRQLYHNCVTNIDDIDEYLTGWFMKAKDPLQHPVRHEIRRENLAEWIAWAFFAQPLENVLEDESLSLEMYSMIDDFEKHFGVHFEEGYDEDIVAVRLTLDPVQAYHRPLAFYLFVFGLHHLANYLFTSWGLEKHGPDVPSSFSLHDPATTAATTPSILTTPSSCTEKVAYWFRDGDRTKKPIVFIHGIGPGWMPYLKFVQDLLALDAPVFCVELPFVSMRCTADVPTMQETADDLQRMLHYHGFTDAVFVAHSLGTAVTSWALKLIPRCISGTVLLDPICFMLHYKDICVNFVYRIPKTASESIVKYFASSELYISHYISRHFHWFQTALYVSPPAPEEPHTSTTVPRNTKVFLSEHDNIVNSTRAHAYLERNQVDSVIMPGLDHGWFLFKSKWQKQVLDTISNFIEA